MASYLLNPSVDFVTKKQVLTVKDYDRHLVSFDVLKEFKNNIPEWEKLKKLQFTTLVKNGKFVDVPNVFAVAKSTADGNFNIYVYSPETSWGRDNKENGYHYRTDCVRHYARIILR